MPTAQGFSSQIELNSLDPNTMGLTSGLLLTALVVPVGAVLPWLKSYTNTPQTLPSAFVECNGQVLNDTASVYHGQTIPNLNGSGGTKRFLRGSTTSGTTGGSETHSHVLPSGHVTSTNAGTQTPNSGTSTDPESTLPSYYEVVFILRVK